VPVWDIYNDFRFLGLLKDDFSVRWVDPGFLGKAVGRREINTATRGPRAWIYIQRPTSVSGNPLARDVSRAAIPSISVRCLWLSLEQDQR